MTEMKIAEGITLICSEQTARRVELECFPEAPERDPLGEDTLLHWLANPANRSDPNYSDIYKDVHGVRPRG